MKKLIYFVDDDPLANKLFQRICDKLVLDCEVFNNAEECIYRLREQQPDIILTDLNMPGIDGFELIKIASSEWPGIPIIAITGQSSIDRAVKAMREGACDFIKKPYEIDELKSSIELNIKYSRLTTKVKKVKGNDYNMIGESAEIHRVFKMIDRLSVVDCSVVISGESGTGKELAARAIHNRGNRRSSPFVAIDCGTLPDNLLESELFGHVKGAFTDATDHRTGLFESAGKGTIFLDEIGSISNAMQTRLLRACQENVVIPVGSNQKIPINARLIFASNRNLEKMVAAGEFRHDLYHRINVISLPMPSLRQRRSDIPLIIDNFVDEFAEKYNLPFRKFTNSWKKTLQQLPWKGNIRELKNYVERCTILSDGDTLDEISLAELEPSNTDQQDNFISLKKIEKKHIQHILKSVNGNQDKAAQILEISRSTLWQKLNDYP